MSLNLMMMFQYVPLIVAVALYFLSDGAPTVQHALYAPLLGANTAHATPTSNLIMGIYAEQLNVPVLGTGRTVAIVALIALTVLTWGWQNVGSTYNLRSLIRGDSCFLFSDYFYAIRRNLKQGFFFGLMDVAVILVLAVDFFYFSSLSDIFVFGVMYFIFLVLAFIYAVMRFYIYHMMITFDLSIRKLLKNALIFVALGIKRNLMALLGLATVFALNIALIFLGFRIGTTLPLILPIFYLPALSGFIAGYGSWPIIQRYMIDPYETDTPADGEEDDTDTPVGDTDASADGEDSATTPAAD